MFKQLKTDYVSWMVLVGVALLLLEIVFFDGGLLFSLVFTIAIAYYGRKSYARKRGRFMFWAGLFATVITVLNMMIFKFFLLALIVYVIVVFYRSKKNPEIIKPLLVEPQPLVDNRENEPLLKKSQLFENKLFGRQTTPDHIYEWNDINIQGGIGDTIVDLSNTILPKGEAVISIRNLIGNIKILVPYDIEVSIHHSVFSGKAHIFQHQENMAFNQIISYQTADYQNAGEKVKIITSHLTGNLEVKRI
ncbi:cell wall-active antibiotics response protein LiaF [Bacillus sp. V5-8f]|uniref:cell wall-active antibiotics response protein LiaF n=1 Tax=Bacillus sp. V5-8f TaxID=2053044 RepID=UPI000C77FE5D|nr:cell wall-active antibiotics response protein LiaF [Bacillus sp. V5-8f]PLT35959.1 cell wall-active antibiotics response protein [Bacillus sp. V5-8f]